MPHRQSVVAQMQIHEKKVAAQRKAKRKNPKVVNAIHLAHRVAIVVTQVIRVAVIHQVAVIHHLPQVNHLYRKQKKNVKISYDETPDTLIHEWSHLT